jgi:hypothetical protein
MTQPQRAEVDVQTGERTYPTLHFPVRHYFSVTSVLNALPKQRYLVPWAAKVVAETAVELYQGWNDNASIDEEEDWEAWAKDLAQVWKWERDAGGDLGTAVHAAAEEILRVSKGNAAIASAMMRAGGWGDDVCERLRYLCKFLDENEVVVEDTEFTLYNDKYEYAGSCDLAAYVNGEPYIIDIKTNKTLTPDIALQIAAYANGHYVIDDDGAKGYMPFNLEDGVFWTSTETWERVRGAILHLGATHCKLVEVDVSDSVFDVFVLLTQLRKLWFNGAEKDAMKDVLYDSRK